MRYSALCPAAVLASVLVLGCGEQQPPTAPAGVGNAPALAPVTGLAWPLAAAGRGTPTREPIPDEANTADFPAGLVCSFELAVDVVANNEVATTFPAKPNGDVVVLITGRLVNRITNVETGESITVNVSGPLRITFHPDGSATTENEGRTLVFLFPFSIPAGPRTFINSGRVVFTFAPGGPPTLVTLTGQQEDICAALS
jgi:hypothetical protein